MEHLSSNLTPVQWACASSIDLARNAAKAELMLTSLHTRASPHLRGTDAADFAVVRLFRAIDGIAGSVVGQLRPDYATGRGVDPILVE